MLHYLTIGIKALVNDKKELYDKIDVAKGHQEKLKNAENSYERKSIHNTCYSLFRVDNPAKFIFQARRRIKSIKRDIRKKEDEINYVIKHILSSCR